MTDEILTEDQERERRAAEFAMRRALTENGEPPPSPNLEAFDKARNEAADWRGKCAQCGHTRVGTLALLKTPCSQCGYGHIMKDQPREEGS